MDFLECKICHVPYDEEGHRPRNAPCGHEICSACLRALIKDSIFECPKCRQKNKVDVPDDLPVCFALIDVIRAFKTKNIPLKKETEKRTSGASNDEVCKVHHKAIGHRCLKCQVWICDDCLDSHSTLMGCSTISSSNAMSSMKEKHTKDIRRILTIFKDDANSVSSKIQEHTNKQKEHLEKAKKHGEEVEKLRNVLEQGNIHKDKLVESENHLKSTNSPYAMMDKIEELTQRKQLLCSWSVKNQGADSLIGLIKALREGKYSYAEMVIKDEKRHAKLSQHEENIYFHFFCSQTVTDDCICVPFGQLQAMIPTEVSLVFVELSLGGVVKGRVLVRLDKNLPNIRRHIVHIVTGQCGPSLAGTTFNKHDGDEISFYDQPFSKIPVTPDSSGSTTGKRGDVIGYFQNGYLYTIRFFVAMPPKTYQYCSSHRVFGHIEDGLDIVQECYNNYSRGVKITDCGLVIE